MDGFGNRFGLIVPCRAASLFAALFMLGLSVEPPEVESVATRLAHQPGERGTVVRRRPRDDPRQSGALVRGVDGSGSQSVHRSR